ncbi:MAG: VWA domain-containing protein [Acidobacteria bacterium]|nr:VWA domain-containing protein [Acidobacteriota bacterium]
MKKRPLYFATALILCCIPLISAQYDGTEPEPQESGEPSKIKVEIELMEVQAIVTDREGRAVEDLGKEDFELQENGVPQEISFFTVSKIEAGSIRPESVEAEREKGSDDAGEAANGSAIGQEAEATVRSAPAHLREPPVRTTLLYVDNLHMSFSSLNWVKQALHRFINEQMTEQDVVALAASHTLGVSQQFTRDRQLLHYAVEQMRFGSQNSSSYFTPNIAAGVLDERQDALRLAVDIVRIEDKIECPCSLLLQLARTRARQILSQTTNTRRNTLAILGDYAGRMVDLPGKRMIVVFSDGFTMRDSMGGVNQDALHSAINRAVRSGVVIYSIDAAGVHLPPTVDASRSRPAQGFSDEGLMSCYRECEHGSSPFIEECIEQGAGGADPRLCCMKKCMEKFPGTSCPEDKNAGPNPLCFSPGAGMLEVYASEFEQEQLNGLHRMAEETGGKMYSGTNNLNKVLGQAFDANGYYYVLSYYPPERDDRDRFRDIKVRVPNHPEYTIRAPRGFRLSDTKIEFTAAEEDTPQRRLLTAMQAPLPITDLGVSAQADFIETERDGNRVSLTVYFEGDRFQYRSLERRNAFKLEILSVFYDSSGKQVEGISAQVEGKLTQYGMEQARKSGYRFCRRLPLEPGVYQARIGVREEGTDRIGTASTWVEVPEISDDRLEMSSLILCNPLDADPIGEEGIRVGKLEQVKMVQGVPMYERDDIFYYIFRIHRAMDAQAGSGIQWMWEVLQGGHPIMQVPWTEITEEELDTDSKGWADLDGEVDIREFDTGVYELRVSVKDIESNRTVTRTASFGIL